MVVLNTPSVKVPIVPAFTQDQKKQKNSYVRVNRGGSVWLGIFYRHWTLAVNISRLSVDKVFQE
jgi:hypothetical protein